MKQRQKAIINADHAAFGERSTVESIETKVLFRPETPELRFLPECPYSLGNGRISYIAIQHGANSLTGSLNVFDVESGVNKSHQLPGRPGFAFPCDRAGLFVVGLERRVGLLDTNTGSWESLLENIETSVTNTIINDAVIVGGNLVFGCKDLEFKTKKAGLYLWRRSDGETIQLCDDQICSNGKAILPNADGSITLLDIDSGSRQITRRALDIHKGKVGPSVVVVDLGDEIVSPDGMILTPDRESLIVAIYDPSDSSAGMARQYGVRTGRLERVWRCPGSPRVTCPQLLQIRDRVYLVLTSAADHATTEQLQRHTNAGCLFIGDTPFSSIGDQPTFEYPRPR